jgi:hypothetical protein
VLPFTRARVVQPFIPFTDERNKQDHEGEVKQSFEQQVHTEPTATNNSRGISPQQTNPPKNPTNGCYSQTCHSSLYTSSLKQGEELKGKSARTMLNFTQVSPSCWARPVKLKRLGLFLAFLSHLHQGKLPYVTGSLASVGSSNSWSRLLHTLMQVGHSVSRQATKDW